MKGGNKKLVKIKGFVAPLLEVATVFSSKKVPKGHIWPNS